MTPDAPSTALDDATLTAIADEASADRRSVQRRLLGLPVRGLARQRIDRVLAARGLRVHDEGERRA